MRIYHELVKPTDANMSEATNNWLDRSVMLEKESQLGRQTHNAVYHNEDGYYVWTGKRRSGGKVRVIALQITYIDDKPTLYRLVLDYSWNREMLAQHG